MRAIVLSFVLAAAVCAAPATYKVLGKIPIGGEGGWDYATVDSAARRIYVSHVSRVVVVDLVTEKVVGEIPETPGVHGIALAPLMGKGFISNGRGNNVTIFDLKTLKATGHVPAGQNPDAIFYDAHSGRVFVFNGRSKDATVIDAATGKVAATIALGGKPEFPASDGSGRLWVNIEDTYEIVEINTAKMAVTKRYPLTGCEDPTGLALDVKRKRLFSTCGNKVMVVSDPDAGKVVASVPIGEGSDGAGIDPDRGLIFSSNGADGTLTLVHFVDGKYEVALTIPTAKSARTMVVDPGTHRVYLPAAVSGQFLLVVVGQ